MGGGGGGGGGERNKKIRNYVLQITKTSQGQIILNPVRKASHLECDVKMHQPPTPLA